MQRRPGVAIALVSMLAVGRPALAANASEQSVDELRNTVVAVMEALVQRGLLTRAQAEDIVRDAQNKAAAATSQQLARDEAERNAVVVARIPETVKQDIVKQVGNEVRPLVTEDVLTEAREKRWGVPGAMPDWLSRISWNGDVRVRAQSDNFASTNIPNLVPDYQAINEAGSLSGAGIDAYQNVTEDRYRMRLRARAGMIAQVTEGLTAGVRVSTGSLNDPLSQNQTLGKYGEPFQVVFDRAYLNYRFNSNGATLFDVTLGRMASPWVSHDLVWDPDLNFDGVSGTFRFDLDRDSNSASDTFLTVGAFPLQEIERSGDDKWLYGAQAGINYEFDGGLQTQLVAGYYYFDKVSGTRNAVDSTLLNYTAPAFLQKGNTVFDILNDANPDSYLFAVAPEYQVLDVLASVSLPIAEHRLTVTGQYIDNLGYNKNDVLHQFGYDSIDDVPDSELLTFKARTSGWLMGLAAGTQTTGNKGTWRASLAYRFLDRDATLDAFTDSDFHLGGTAASGYVFRGDWWFMNRSWLTLRYYSADEASHTVQTGSGQFTDASPYGVDTLMLDINAQF